MGVYGTFFSVGGGGLDKILVGWIGWGWVGMSEGEWVWVHCLIMPIF